MRHPSAERGSSIVGIVNSDTVARSGGEAFVLTLPDMSEESLELSLSQILEMIRRTREIESRKIDLSGSPGIIIFPNDPAKADSLAFHPDQSMCAVKSKKGQVVPVCAPFPCLATRPQQREAKESPATTMEEQEFVCSGRL